MLRGIGRPAGDGRWLVAPVGAPQVVRRRYHPGTLVLESEVTTAEGTVRVLDAMPPRRDGPVLVRAVEGIRGRVRMRMVLAARFGYGKIRPWAYLRGPRAASMGAGPDAFLLQATAPLEVSGHDVTAGFSVGGGERVTFALARSLTTPPGPTHRRARGDPR